MDYRGGPILDAGCCGGETLIELVKAFPRSKLAGVDLSEELLELARSRAEEEGLAQRIDFRRADVTALPFPDDQFEFVLSQDMLQVVLDAAALVDELARVSRSEGFFYIRAIKRSWLAALVPILKIAFSAAEARELLNETRLRPWRLVENTWYYTILPQGAPE